jgi:hypothetical protein
MKTKIAITVALCALFVAVPSATPKGKPGPSALPFTAACGIDDVCSFSGSGLAPNTSYGLSYTDGCGTFLGSTSLNTDGTGALSKGQTVAPSETGCPNPGWIFTLSTLGKRSSTVGMSTAIDSVD